MWASLENGIDRPLSNRAAQGTYPPGSVFKIFTSIAALEEGVSTVNETIKCGGYLKFGGRRFHCHKRQGHGKVNLYSALVQSCDVYFYTIASRLGVDRIHRYASLFGFGNKTDFDLSNESPGLIPSHCLEKACLFKKRGSKVVSWRDSFSWNRPRCGKYYPTSSSDGSFCCGKWWVHL